MLFPIVVYILRSVSCWVVHNDVKLIFFTVKGCKHFFSMYIIFHLWTLNFSSQSVTLVLLSAFSWIIILQFSIIVSDIWLNKNVDLSGLKLCWSSHELFMKIGTIFVTSSSFAHKWLLMRDCVFLVDQPVYSSALSAFLDIHHLGRLTTH